MTGKRKSFVRICESCRFCSIVQKAYFLEIEIADEFVILIYYKNT